MYYINESKDMILRDYLAADRTAMANERTLLAYIRTFLGTFGAGVALFHFTDTLYLIVIGYTFCVVSFFFLGFGFYRFFQVSKRVKIHKKSD